MLEAVTVGRQAVELAADDYEFAFSLDTLGWALFKAGETDEAIRILDQAVRTDGFDVMLRNHLEEARAAAG